MFIKDTLFSSPISNLDSWNFNEKVAEVFPDMVQRSIPGYSDIIFMIGIFARHFAQSDTQIYDLGCALGEATISICRNINQKNCKILAVDSSSSMIKQFQRHVESHKISIPIDIIQADIRDIDIHNASIVVLNFTLQFLSQNEQQEILNKIYKGLIPNGILILSEKFSFENKKINSLLFNMHRNFKRINGYSELEIVQKNAILENVMFTNSLETHKTRLKKAGFSQGELWFQYLNFGSLIGLK